MALMFASPPPYMQPLGGAAVTPNFYASTRDADADVDAEEGEEGRGVALYVDGSGYHQDYDFDLDSVLHRDLQAYAESSPATSDAGADAAAPLSPTHAHLPAPVLTAPTPPQRLPVHRPLLPRVEDTMLLLHDEGRDAAAAKLDAFRTALAGHGVAPHTHTPGSNVSTDDDVADELLSAIMSKHRSLVADGIVASPLSRLALLLHLVVVLVLLGCGGCVGADAAPADGGLPFTGDERYLVLSVHRLGLANRLRALADWHQVAQLSNRQLLVSWEPTRDCNASFTDLFAAGPPGIKVLPFVLPAGRAGLARVVEMAIASGLTAAVLDDDDTFPDEHVFVPGTGSFVVHKSRLVGDGTPQVLATDHNGVVVLEGIRCQHYMRAHSAFLSSLVPSEFPRAFVADFKKTYFSTQLMVGVHVRVHDPQQDWAVVPPLQDNAEMAVNFGVGASVEQFTSYMQQMQQHFAPHARFFVASNSPEVKAQLLERFPEAVTLSGDYSRGSTDGIVFALIEWLLLAEAALVLNTYGSSFAVEAAQVHMRPLVGLWDNKLLHHHNHMQPFCAHLLFAKARNQGPEKSYTEANDGASFQRTVASSEVFMNPSSILSDWGLTNVYSIAP